MAISDINLPTAAPAFLASCGWEGAEVRALSGDASFRRYFRVFKDDNSALLMDAPPPREDPRSFVAMAQYLTGIGLNAPHIYHSDLSHGLLLIEDFGDDQMRQIIDADIASEERHYRGVVDVLLELQRHAPPSWLEVHGMSHWLDEVELFIDWYGSSVGLSLDSASFRAAWEAVLAPIEHDSLPWVTELRDYHAENVMLVAGASGIGQYGLLDFQDARIGHPAYDLVSMLQDARRDVTPTVEAQMLDYYIAQTARGQAFVDAYWVLGAQRNTRILGVFCRLSRRDGKQHYTSFQPRMWGLLERDLAQPVLAPVKAWFDAHIPAHLRADFWIGVNQ